MAVFVPFSVGIVAHPSRKANVEQLCSALTAQMGEEPMVAWSNWQPGRTRDTWRTYSDAMAFYDPSRPWHLVLEDDVLLCERFTERLTELLQHSDPNRIHSLYYHNNTVQPCEEFGKLADAALLSNSHGFLWHSVWGSQGLVFPSKLVSSIIYYGNHQQITDDPHGGQDRRVSAFAKARHIKIHYTIPCLVNHHPEYNSLVFDEGGDDVHGTDNFKQGLPNHKRQSPYFLG